MTAALETVLAEAGLRVTADEFLSRLTRAAQQLSPVHITPKAYFTTEQQAVLHDVGLDLEEFTERDRDPRMDALIAKAVLRDSALSVAEAAEVLHVDTSRIRHRLSAGRLAGWKDRGEWRLPAWQFASNGVLPGLELVLTGVPDDQPALAVAAFMTTPQADLRSGHVPTTPRAWLLAGGDPARVAALASALGTPA